MLRLPDQQALDKLQADIKARSTVRRHVCLAVEQTDHAAGHHPKGNNHGPSVTLGHFVPLRVGQGNLPEKPSRKPKEPLTKLKGGQDMGVWLHRQLLALKLPLPVFEHKFHPSRKWRFDLAWPDLKIAVEIEGGIWNQGRHTRGVGFLADMIKYNEATRLGWRVYRFSTTFVKKGKALAYMQKVLAEG